MVSHIQLQFATCDSLYRLKVPLKIGHIAHDLEVVFFILKSRLRGTAPPVRGDVRIIKGSWVQVLCTALPTVGVDVFFFPPALAQLQTTTTTTSTTTITTSTTTTSTITTTASALDGMEDPMSQHPAHLPKTESTAWALIRENISWPQATTLDSQVLAPPPQPFDSAPGVEKNPKAQRLDRSMRQQTQPPLPFFVPPIRAGARVSSASRTQCQKENHGVNRGGVGSYETPGWGNRGRLFPPS